MGAHVTRVALCSTGSSGENFLDSASLHTWRGAAEPHAVHDMPLASVLLQRAQPHL